MSALKSRNNYLLIYRIYSPPLLLQFNKPVVVIISMITYDIAMILLSAAVAVAHDIVMEINIIVVNRIIEIIA